MMNNNNQTLSRLCMVVCLILLIVVSKGKTIAFKVLKKKIVRKKE